MKALILILALVALAVPAVGQTPTGTPAPQAAPNVYRIANGSAEYVQTQGVCYVFSNHTGTDIPVFAGSAAEFSAAAQHMPPSVTVSACSFPPTAINGSCPYSDQTTQCITQAPYNGYDSCSTGTWAGTDNTSTHGNFVTHSWVCAGSNGGTSASCACQVETDHM